MIIRYLLQFLELFQKITLSYGQMFTIASAIMAKGLVVAKATFKILENEKYKPAMKHYQKGVLMLYAALAEFKSGHKVMADLIEKNPEDFKDLMEFYKEITEEFPGVAEECFKAPVEFSKMLGEGFGKDTSKVPEFIRTSGEYMDYINSGKREISEEQFKTEILKRYLASPMAMLRILKKTKSTIEVKGWASLDPKDGNDAVIMWADEFNMDLPAQIAAALNCSATWPYAEIDGSTVIDFNKTKGQRPAVWPELPKDLELTGHVNENGPITHPPLNSGDDVMKFRPENGTPK